MARPRSLPAPDALAALRRDGTTVADLAQQYGVTTTYVYQELNAGGYDGRGRPRPDDHPDPDIVQAAQTRAAHHQTTTLPGLNIPGEWADDALCAQVDGDLFYPEKGGPTAPAKSICQRCPVAAECLDFALSNGERFGIWGGVTERARRRLTPPSPAA